MAPKYHSFQDLPTEVADRLKVRIVEGEQRQYPATPEDATMDERMADHVEAFKNPDYTEEQLASIVDAFTVFNTAVKRGLPNQLYQMMARTLDVEIELKKGLDFEKHRDRVLTPHGMTARLGKAKITSKYSNGKFVFSRGCEKILTLHFFLAKFASLELSSMPMHSFAYLFKKYKK